MMRSSVERRLDRSEQIRVTPETAGWTYLAYSLHVLEPGQTVGDELADRETAIVVLEGQADLQLGGEAHAVARRSVFTELSPVGYAPPGVAYEVTARTGLVVAVGSAPAEGRYPARLIEPSRIRSEVRGGGAALRQVSHTLAPPLEAERLILYEVYVPRGSWSGWPPHRHDGEEGSPYLEEVYYFRLDRPEGFWMHRNFAGSNDGREFDETIVGGDGDAALVPFGYHSSVACPGANMYFLNYLAGELVDEARSTPPCFHSDHTWIESDWGHGAWELPIIGGAGR
jgi:5-deoxy-glucuronate isomerase